MREFIEGLDEALRQDVNLALVLGPEDRQKVSRLLHDWLENRARKLTTPDLDARMSFMRDRINKLAEELVVEMSEEGGITLSVIDSEASMTLEWITRGSNWFSPYDLLLSDVRRVLLSS
jgi:hypothetical protein